MKQANSRQTMSDVKPNRTFEALFVGTTDWPLVSACFAKAVRLK